MSNNIGLSWFQGRSNIDLSSYLNLMSSFIARVVSDGLDEIELGRLEERKICVMLQG